MPRVVYAVFYFGWPGSGLKAVGSTDDRARDVIDVLVETGEAAPGVRYDSQRFGVVPIPLNAVEIGGRAVPLREAGYAVLTREDVNGAG